MKRPKPRIKEVFEKTLKNGGNVSKAMRAKKYRPATINNPSNVTGTKSWEMLLDEYIPETLIAETHKEAFGANKPIGALVLIKNDKNGNAEQILKDNEGVIEVPDWQIRMKATELGYKVRGKLTDKTDITSKGEKIETNTILFSNFKDGTESK